MRRYCRYGVSYRDLEEMMTERGVPVNHTTILTAGCRNMPLNWTSKRGGTGRYLTGRLRDRADRSGLLGRASLPAIGAPGLPDQPANNDHGVG